MERDYSLDVIRVTAMAMILLCHFFQVIGVVRIAFWLNTGVQIFFVLSAFLLCKRSLRSVSDRWTFIKKRFIRIMIPLWTYLVTIVAALLVLGYSVKPDAVILYALGLTAFSPNGVLGLGHLWYITAILICYAMLPVLELILTRVKRRTTKIVAFTLLAGLCLALFWRFSFIAYGVDVLFFLLMVLFFRQSRSAESEERLWKWCALPTLIFVAGTVILANNAQVSMFCYEIVMTAAKCLLAVVIFCTLHLYVPKARNARWICYLSGLSYEVYLTHQFILLLVNRIQNSFGIHGVPNYLITFVVSIPIIWMNTVVVSKASKFLIRILRN